MELNTLKKRFHLFLWISFAWFQPVQAQRTVGLLVHSPQSFPGYTLFAPSFSRNAFLIDHCGYAVKKWTFPTTTLDLDLLPDGKLFRTSRALGNFTGGGAGGRLELYDWEGKLLWNSIIADEKMHHHHEAQFLPNGHLLLCVWYKYSKEEALQKGFKPEKLTNNGIWSDRILEIKVLPDNAYEIVWEWDFWDHTIQDIRPDLPGYGTVSDHPELLDVNFFEDPGANPAEWIHVNSLDYNAVLDQILISSKFHNEIYIIDHSTTREEAKGHAGGRYGKGGDFLYRWGNPRSYGRGTREHHWLFGQHDAQWIADSLPGAGNLLLFNNGSNRLGELYSTIDEIVPPDNGTGTYPIDPGLRFQPELPVWMFTSTPRSGFYSARISGVQRLPNGNTLACEGNAGRFVEVNEDGEIVWLYRNPVNQSGPLEQGKMPSNVDVFRINRYPENYAAFVGRTLSPTGPIEVDASGYDCSKLSQSLQQTMDDVTLVTPNPASHWIQCQFDGEISIFTLRGEKIMETPVAKNAHVDISHLPASMYLIRCFPHGVAIPIHINMVKF